MATTTKRGTPYATTVIRKTRAHGGTVSTISHPAEAWYQYPVIFETCVLGGPHNGRQTYATSLAEAEADHAAFVAGRFPTSPDVDEDRLMNSEA